MGANDDDDDRKDCDRTDYDRTDYDRTDWVDGDDRMDLVGTKATAVDRVDNSLAEVGQRHRPSSVLQLQLRLLPQLVLPWLPALDSDQKAFLTPCFQASGLPSSWLSLRNWPAC